MLRDYNDRFYSKEGARTARLQANGYALAKEIVAWKENVASKWNDVKCLDIQTSDSLQNGTLEGTPINATVKVDTAGLTDSIHVELVAYRDMEGELKFHSTRQFTLDSVDGDVCTYKLDDKIHDSGMFRYAFRVYPWNDNLPHRQDFAYMKWF